MASQRCLARTRRSYDLLSGDDDGSISAPVTRSQANNATSTGLRSTRNSRIVAGSVQGLKRIRESSSSKGLLEAESRVVGVPQRRAKQQRLDPSVIGRLAAGVQELSTSDQDQRAVVQPPAGEGMWGVPGDDSEESGGANSAAGGASKEQQASKRQRVMDELQVMDTESDELEVVVEGGCTGHKGAGEDWCHEDAEHCQDGESALDIETSTDSDEESDESSGDSKYNDLDMWLHGTADWWTH
ncbi:unnamed protein product [Chrysoparadoxa australica]